MQGLSAVASTYVATYAEYRGAGRTKPREEPLAHRLGLSGSRRKRARLGGLGSPQRGLRFVRLEPSGDGQAGNRECPTPERNRPSPFLISAEKLDRFSSPEVRARIRRSRSEKRRRLKTGDPRPRRASPRVVHQGRLVMESLPSSTRVGRAGVRSTRGLVPRR
jgi:hypothetical protein